VRCSLALLKFQEEAAMTPYEVSTARLPATNALAIRATVQVRELPAFIERAFAELTQTLHTQGAQPIDPPFVRYHSFTPQAVEVEAVMCCANPVQGKGRAVPLTLEASEAAIVRHVGPYAQIGPAYDALRIWLEEHGKHATQAPREVYLTRPDDETKIPVTLVEQPMG
jgi:effector-binding domain-containing protein